MEEERQRIVTIWVTLFFMVIAFLLIALSGCTRTIYVPVEQSRTDSISAMMAQYEARLVAISSEMKNTINVRDSVQRTDSVVYVVNTEGEVVSKEIWHERVYSHDSSHDKEYIMSVVDSMRHHYEGMIDKIKKEQGEKAVPIEKPKSRWESMIEKIGLIAIGAIVIAMVIAAVKLIRKVS